MTTLELLNAIPGRPEFLLGWTSRGDMPCCHYNDYPMLGDCGLIAISICGGKVICYARNNLPCRDLLSFAIYARRVEIRIERMKGEVE